MAATLTQPQPRVLRNPASLRRGNILLEFISAYGLQVTLIAAALVILAGAYALMSRTTTAGEVRQIVTAAQTMFGKNTGTYKGITTAIIAANAKSDVLPKSLVEGTGTSAKLNINGGELPVHIKDNSAPDSPVKVDSTKYFVMQIGDNTRPIESADMCSELARMRVPRMHTVQVATAAEFTAAAATQTMVTPAAATAVGVTGLTIGDSTLASAATPTAYEFGDESNNARINVLCNKLVEAAAGAMVLYLIN